MDNDLFADAARQVLADQCTPAVVRAIEAGGRAAPEAAALWAQLEATGLADALLPESQGGAGLALSQVFGVLEQCGAHALPLAEGLEMSRVLIPKTAGALSAVGGVFSEVISEFSGSIYTETREFDFKGVNSMLAGLLAQGNLFFERNGIGKDMRAVEVWMEGRYPYQVWEIPVRIDGFLNDRGALDEEGLERMIEAFHGEHEKAFAVREEARMTALDANPRIPFAACGFSDGTVLLAELKRFAAYPLDLEPLAPATSMAWSAQGLHLACTFEDGRVALLDLRAVLAQA